MKKAFVLSCIVASLSFPNYAEAQNSSVLDDLIAQKNINSQAEIINKTDAEGGLESYIVVLDSSLPSQGGYKAASITASLSENVFGTANDILTKALGQSEGGVQRLNTDSVLTGLVDAFVFKGSQSDLAAIAKDPRVLFIEEELEIKPNQISQVPWGLDRIDQRSLPLDQSFEPLNTNVELNVYVLDTGVRETHIEFGGRAKNIANFTPESDGDCDGHGTHVAATIAGKSVGVLPSAKVYAVKVLACNPNIINRSSNIARAINYVSSEFKFPGVVNMSLGGPSNAGSLVLDLAVESAIVRGIPIVVAAGNSRVDACAVSPARVPDAITVAASDKFDRLAEYSNFGSCVDIIAPGTGVLSAWIDTDTSYKSIDGTSMAAPHVAAVGLLLYHGNRGNDQRDMNCLLQSQSTEGLIKGLDSATQNRFLHIGESSPNCFENFRAPKLLTESFLSNVWTRAKHPRHLADVNGDGKSDIVGFANDGVYVSLTDNEITTATKWTSSFLSNVWTRAKHPRHLADVNGDGKSDIVGFANDGVYVSLSDGETYTTATKWTSSFLSNVWTRAKHPRHLADVNGDGKSDIVGFANDGVYVSLSDGETYTTATKWTSSFLSNVWTRAKHPRHLADVNGDGKSDIVGFANDGVYVSLSDGETYTTATKWVRDFNSNIWSTSKHPRHISDLNGDGKSDVVGFANDGVYVSYSK